MPSRPDPASAPGTLPTPWEPPGLDLTDSNPFAERPGVQRTYTKFSGNILARDRSRRLRVRRLPQEPLWAAAVAVATAVGGGDAALNSAPDGPSAVQRSVMPGALVIGQADPVDRAQRTKLRRINLRRLRWSAPAGWWDRPTARR
ncbi:hypothetical protein GCM10010442_07270 [Kitasatospora kifunensis]